MTNSCKNHILFAMFARVFCDVFALSESMQLHFTHTLDSRHIRFSIQSAQHQTLFAIKRRSVSSYHRRQINRDTLVRYEFSVITGNTIMPTKKEIERGGGVPGPPSQR